jgi:hypothetical protein
MTDVIAALFLAALLGLLFGVLLMNVCWIYFIAIMKLRDMKDAGQIAGVMKLFGYPNLFIGLLLDVLVNWIPMTIIFMELPLEFLTTARLSRHIKDGSGWRKDVALWFCHNLLSPFDSSKDHCGEK